MGWGKIFLSDEAKDRAGGLENASRLQIGLELFQKGSGAVFRVRKSEEVDQIVGR